MTDSQILKFTPKDAAKDPDHVLERAKGVYDSVFIIGYDKDGNIDQRASTNLKPSEVNYLIDIFKHKLLNGDYTE
jgi:hypothetical protein